MNPQRTAPQFDLPPGTMLGKYELVRKLAMGGMAEIYLARSRGSAGFEKLVVIKRILPTVADDPKFVRMFLDEARLAATLQHPNIADVYEVGEHDGAPFFTMEFVHGHDVRTIRMSARERKESIPLAIALAIVSGTAHALDYAHDRVGPDGQNLGLVHRDVSSSNILVSYDGAIKLIDFGIARATGTTHKTKTGTLKGKIPYMSPEQCRGGGVDRRSDLFSLGVVMYELTVGRRPFRGETDFAIMDQIVHRGAEKPSTLMRGYPPELEAIVMRLLARHAEDRYQTAEEMLHDLDPFLQQHRLWAGAKPISRYMRTVFAEHVDAWDKAAQGGVTLAQHLLTATSRSATSMTPPSTFPAVLPLSQEMPAVAVQTGDFELEAPTEAFVDAASTTPLPASPPAAVADMPSRPTEYPSIKKSRVSLVVAAIAIVGIGGAGSYFAMSRGGEVATGSVQPAAIAAPVSPPTPTPKPVRAEPTPVVEAKPEAKPEPTPVVEAKPEPAPVVKTDEPPSSKPVVPKRPVVVSKRPVPKRTAVPAKPEDEQTKDAKDAKVTPKDKDPAWNIDSPFLPSQH